jgi:integrase
MITVVGLRAESGRQHLAVSRAKLAFEPSLRKLRRHHRRRFLKPAASTAATWKAPVASLIAFLGHEDARRISETDIVRWKDHLVARRLSPKTINDVYLASIKVFFNHAVRDRLISTNPVANIKVADRRQAGRAMQPYTDAEVRHLLRLAATQTDPSRRWLPWLAAATGARIGELAQLWGRRIKVVDGAHIMELRPAEDGGSFKNEESERIVPLHPVLIEAGFLLFIEARGDGPLFYRRSSGDSSKRHASKGVTNRLAGWIREAGFNDPRKSPNHALRHWWKTAAMRAGVSDSVADAVQGHAPNSVAGRYRHFDVQTLRLAVESIRLPPREVERSVV